MPYEDVPARLIAGEDVPWSEIMGYALPMNQIQATLVLRRLEDLFMVEREFIEGRMYYRITEFGLSIRQDFLTRIEGDCPEE